MFGFGSNKKTKRKNLILARLTDDRYDFRYDNSQDIIHAIAKNKPVSFLIVNEFIHAYNVTRGKSNHVNSDYNVPVVYRHTLLRDFIDNNGFTLSKIISDHIADSKVNMYSHTKSLFDLYYLSVFPSDSVYEGMDFGSSRYFFFPEYGVNGDMIFSTPEFLLAAISYHDGDKSCTASVDHCFKNVVAHHYWRSGNAFIYDADLFIWHGLVSFNKSFNGEMKIFSNKTLEDMNNLLFSLGDSSCLNGDSYYYVAKRYVLAELIDHCNNNSRIFDFNEDVMDYFNDNNNFSRDTLMARESWELDFILSKKIK